jgi:hypothetical protein
LEAEAAAAAAAAERAQREYAAAVGVQRVVRGHLGRRRVVAVMFNRGAVKLQSLWRGHKGRARARGVRGARPPLAPPPTPPSPEFGRVVVEEEALGEDYYATQIQKVRGGSVCCCCSSSCKHRTFIETKGCPKPKEEAGCTHVCNGVFVAG